MPLPSDLKDLLDPGKDAKPYGGPIYWLWVFDPMTAKIHLTHNEDRHPAHSFTLRDLAPEANHPSRLEGYVYKIKGGYRITDAEHKPVEDPYITERIVKALEHEHEEEGAPRKHEDQTHSPPAV